MAAGSSIVASMGSVSAQVADNVTLAVGSNIHAHTSVLIQGDYQKIAGQTGSIIAISGQIFAPTAAINGGVDSDTISLTNVVAGTVTTVTTGGGVNTVNVGSIPPPVPNGGDVDKIQGPLTIVGNGTDTTERGRYRQPGLPDGHPDCYRPDRPGHGAYGHRLQRTGLPEHRSRQGRRCVQRQVERRGDHVHDHHPGRRQHLERRQPGADARPAASWPGSRAR